MCGAGLVLLVWLALSAPAALAQTPSVQAPLAPASLLLDGAAAGRRLVVVGERGHALFSTDDGATWTQARAPVQALLTAVHMHDRRTGWAVGHDAAILRTRDGGETWRLVHHAPRAPPLLDVWFRDESAGFAVGAFGMFLATADGGDSWTCRNGCPDAEILETTGEAPLFRSPDGAGDEEDFHLNSIAPAGSGRLFLAGEAGVLYRSDDGGRTWRGLPSPYRGSWFGALAVDVDTVLVAGLRGRLFRSEDAGESWTRIETGTNATLTDVVRARSDLILVTGLAGTLLASRDGRRVTSSRPLASRRGISTALPTSGRGVLLIGEFGVKPVSGLE